MERRRNEEVARSKGKERERERATYILSIEKKKKNRKKSFICCSCSGSKRQQQGSDACLSQGGLRCHVNAGQRILNSCELRHAQRSRYDMIVERRLASHSRRSPTAPGCQVYTSTSPLWQLRRNSSNGRFRPNCPLSPMRGKLEAPISTACLSQRRAIVRTIPLLTCLSVS